MATIDNTPNRIEPHKNISVSCSDIFKSIFQNTLGCYIPLDAFMWEAGMKAYSLYLDNRLDSILPNQAKISIYLSEDTKYYGRYLIITAYVNDTQFGISELFNPESFMGRYDNPNIKELLDEVFLKLPASIIYNSLNNELNPKPVKFDFTDTLLFARLSIIGGILFITMAAIAAYFSLNTF